jgi:hypothetical protein
MLTALSERVLDPQLMTSALIAIATAATIWTLAAPFLEGESLEKRMKAVAIERDRIRARERERMAKAQQKPSLRQQPTFNYPHLSVAGPGAACAKGIGHDSLSGTNSQGVVPWTRRSSARHGLMRNSPAAPLRMSASASGCERCSSG